MPKHFCPCFWELGGDVGWVVGLQLDDDTHKRRSNQSVPRRPWYGEACFLLPGRILDLIFVILKPVFGLLSQCSSFIAPTVSDSYKRSKYGKSYWDQGRVSASQRFWRCAQAHWRMGPISGLGHWNIQVVSKYELSFETELKLFVAVHDHWRTLPFQLVPWLRLPLPHTHSFCTTSLVGLSPPSWLSSPSPSSKIK